MQGSKGGVATQHFADQLIGRIRHLGQPLCLGLDPHLDRIPPVFRRGSMAAADPETAACVLDFLSAVVERYAGKVAVAKPQMAFFERMGWRGLKVLESLIERARSADLLVLLDGKRGDIGSTARAYAAAYLDREAPLPADALTVNPYLGRDTLAPFIDHLRRHGRGLFVLVKTSNRGSSDYQDRMVEGQPLFEWIAASLEITASSLAGPETGWSSLGVVVGANYAEESERVREHLPNALFLVPGYGAQGASAGEALRGFVPGPNGQREGGIVSSSRALLFPEGGGFTSAAAFDAAIDAARDRAIDELGNAASTQSR